MSKECAGVSIASALLLPGRINVAFAKSTTFRCWRSFVYSGHSVKSLRKLKTYGNKKCENLIKKNNKYEWVTK